MTKTRGAEDTKTLGLPVTCTGCLLPRRGLCSVPWTRPCCGGRLGVTAMEQQLERGGLLRHRAGNQGPTRWDVTPFSGFLSPTLVEDERFKTTASGS